MQLVKRFSDHAAGEDAPTERGWNEGQRPHLVWNLHGLSGDSDGRGASGRRTPDQGTTVNLVLLVIFEQKCGARCEASPVFASRAARGLTAGTAKDFAVRFVFALETLVF
jgi:hypothetical protein